WLVFAILMAVWIRPDGAVVAGIIIVTEAIMYRRLPKFSLSCIAFAFVLSLPFVVFKYSYYGSIFPNPFYAKTGIHLEQLANGLEYTWRFLSHYGFYGAGLLIPILFYRRLSVAAKTVLWLSALFIAYVILIGGDVLKVHRFFLPLFGPMALLLALSIWLIMTKMRRNTRSVLFAAVGLGLIVITVILPYDFVSQYNRREKMFTRKMLSKAQRMKESDNRNFSVALATIGIFGYELLGHKIIDMVGLTDSTIARHSEDPIPGMESTWKEAKHNSKYLLSSAPDYIIFSTDMKPSAPAEKALLLFRQFLECYRSIGWFYQSDPTVATGVLMIAYKRTREITGDIVPTYPVEWVENYKLGLDEYGSGNLERAIKYLEKALKLSPQPYYPYAIYQMAYCNMRLGNHDRAVKLNDLALSIDSSIFESHKDLYIYARFNGDSARAILHRQWLQKLVPWYWPRMRASVEEQMRKWRQSQR
ncbi:MAG: type IV pilus biogenesis/stability protein PilW, partial [bacterium]